MSEPETPLERHPLGHPDYDPDAFDDEPTTCRHCGEELDDLSLDDLDGECYPCALEESKLSRNRAVAALAEERALAKEHVQSASANLTVLAAEKRQAEERAEKAETALATARAAAFREAAKACVRPVTSSDAAGITAPKEWWRGLDEGQQVARRNVEEVADRG